jgi:hypothetical protein
MSIVRIIGHKGLGLFSALINIIVSASVLASSASYYYLTALSVSQVLMVFSGFGVTQRLVFLPESKAKDQVAWPWYLMTLICGVMYFVFLGLSVGAPKQTMLTLFVSLLFLLLVISEWLRVAVSSQKGFIAYNLTLLLASAFLFLEQEVSLFLSLIPLVGCIVLLGSEHAFFFTKGKEKIKPRLADLVRGLRVAMVNQYYNIIVLLMSLIGLRGDVLGLILVYRFSIFYNWQSFYWLRFKHKLIPAGVNDARVKENSKIARLNLIALALTCLIVGVIQLEGFSDVSK